MDRRRAGAMDDSQAEPLPLLAAATGRVGDAAAGAAAWGSCSRRRRGEGRGCGERRNNGPRQVGC